MCLCLRARGHARLCECVCVCVCAYVCACARMYARLSPIPASYYDCKKYKMSCVRLPVCLLLPRLIVCIESIFHSAESAWMSTSKSRCPCFSSIVQHCSEFGRGGRIIENYTNRERERERERSWLFVVVVAVVFNSIFIDRYLLYCRFLLFM